MDRGGRVKVSFFGGLTLGRVGVPDHCEDHGLAVATLIAHGVPLARALGAAQALWADFAPLVTLKALSYFDDGDLHMLPDQVKRTLMDAAGSVRAIDAVPRLADGLT